MSLKFQQTKCKITGEKIPVLFPATKTNIGVPVSTKFKLPLIIKSN